ncbi:MAG: Cof-type HAD-IIB family hydrolase [Ignavibacteriaceae bacterium]
MTEWEKLKNIKLIIFDLDGTLLKNDGSIGKQTKRLINLLEEKNVKFSFATGRLHSAIVDYAAELNITTPLISLDGSYIKSYPDDAIVFESFIKERYVLKALSLAQEFVINIALCHADAIFFTEQNSLIPKILYKFGAKYTEVPSYEGLTANVLEIVFAGDNKRAISYIKDRLSFPFSFGIENSFFRSQGLDNIFYLEIRRKGSSKGEGFLRLLKYLKINPYHSAVVGDWYNDLSLFETKAYKVALANAVPEIKRKANLITKGTNDEEGIAEFLEIVLKSKSG